MQDAHCKFCELSFWFQPVVFRTSGRRRLPKFVSHELPRAATQIEAQYYKCVVHRQPLRKNGNGHRRRTPSSPKVTLREWTY